MTSTGPTNIPLDTLPFLNPRNARNRDIFFTNQPAMSRRPPIITDEEGAGEEDDDDDRDRYEENEDEEDGHGHGHHHDPTASPVHIAPPSSSITPAWRLHLYNLLERPNSSAAAVLVHVLVTVLITFSALITVLETVPAFHSLPGGIWFGLETSLVALFTVEYVARCVATSYSWSGFFGWVGCAFLSLSPPC